eukprot:gene3844-biopygen6209
MARQRCSGLRAARRVTARVFVGGHRTRRAVAETHHCAMIDDQSVAVTHHRVMIDDHSVAVTHHCAMIDCHSV